MRTLNDMPQHWVESSPEVWCPWRALGRGSLWTAVTAAVLAAVMAPVSYYLPGLVFHGIGIVVWSFVAVWILFAVMHRAAGTTGSLCNAVVIAGAVLIQCSNHAFLVLRIVHAGAPAASWWLLWDNMWFVVAQMMFVVGVGVATMWCKDGDDVLDGLVDLAMINPLIGRRV